MQNKYIRLFIAPKISSNEIWTVVWINDMQSYILAMYLWDLNATLDIQSWK